MDDEQLVYPAYEKMRRPASSTSACTRGCSRRRSDQRSRTSDAYCDVRDVGKAAKDWPQLNFIIYHGALPLPGRRQSGRRAGPVRATTAAWTGSPISPRSPRSTGSATSTPISGQLFAPDHGVAAPSSPRPSWARWSAAWARTTSSGAPDAVWTGAPQWQIEGLRRLEIPEDMQKQHGFAPLGAADSPVKRAILGENVARLYGFRRDAELGKPGDRLAALKADYEKAGGGRSNAPLRLRHRPHAPERRAAVTAGWEARRDRWESR